MDIFWCISLIFLVFLLLFFWCFLLFKATHDLCLPVCHAASLGCEFLHGVGCQPGALACSSLAESGLERLRVPAGARQQKDQDSL
jgi:hypothetical protein